MTTCYICCFNASISELYVFNKLNCKFFSDPIHYIIFIVKLLGPYIHCDIVVHYKFNWLDIFVYCLGQFNRPIDCFSSISKFGCKGSPGETSPSQNNIIMVSSYHEKAYAKLGEYLVSTL